MAVPTKSRASSFQVADQKAGALPKQLTRESESVSLHVEQLRREYNTQEGVTLSEAFEPGTSSRVVYHNLQREPTGWYAIDATEFFLIKKLSLPSKYSPKEAIQFEVQNLGASDLQLKVKVF